MKIQLEAAGHQRDCLGVSAHSHSLQSTERTTIRIHREDSIRPQQRPLHDGIGDPKHLIKVCSRNGSGLTLKSRWARSQRGGVGFWCPRLVSASQNRNRACPRANPVDQRRCNPPARSQLVRKRYERSSIEENS